MITAVPGVRVGHWSDSIALTGCTVILLPPGSKGSVLVAGGAPGTRGTDALRPGTLDLEVHAVLLTGGSAFGLAAVDGVMRFLEERGIGLEATPGVRVPIVPAAVIYDLGIGDPAIRPGAEQGYAACTAASAAEAREGNVGAGTGATVGKTAGPGFFSKGGRGGAARHEGELIVGALAVVNAVGDVVDEHGSIIAGARADPSLRPQGSATTLGCIATNAALSKEECGRVARIASAGLARAITPVYTMFDGDTVFALATGVHPSSSVDLVGSLAADALAEAVRRGARMAESVPGAPARGTR
jgi:L-aminopeptidase/D-esterase-like protein